MLGSSHVWRSYFLCIKKYVYILHNNNLLMLFRSSCLKEFSLSFPFTLHLPILISFLFMQHCCCCWSSFYLIFFLPSANVMSFIFLLYGSCFLYILYFFKQQSDDFLLYLFINMHEEMTIKMLMNSPMRFYIYFSILHRFSGTCKKSRMCENDLLFVSFWYIYFFLLYFSLRHYTIIIINSYNIWSIRWIERRRKM